MADDGADRGRGDAEARDGGARHAATVPAASPRARRVSTWKRGVSPPRARGSVSAEQRAPGSRLDLDPAAHPARELACDRQAEPAAVRVRPLDPVEAVEDPLEVLGRDARTVVGHVERHGGRRPPRWRRGSRCVPAGVWARALAASALPDLQDALLVGQRPDRIVRRDDDELLTRCVRDRRRAPRRARLRPRRGSPRPARRGAARRRGATDRAGWRRAASAARPALASSSGSRRASRRRHPRPRGARGTLRARTAASAARAMRWRRTPCAPGRAAPAAPASGRTRRRAAPSSSSPESTSGSSKCPSAIRSAARSIRPIRRAWIPAAQLPSTAATRSAATVAIRSRCLTTCTVSS